jgi:hypothetical protein
VAEAEDIMETLGSWGCLEHGLSTKESHRQQVEPVQETMWLVNTKTIGPGMLKPTGVHIMTLCAMNAGSEATGFSVCPAGFWSYFGFIPFSLLEWESLLCAILYWKYITFFFFKQGLTAKSWPGVSEETLNLNL